MASFLCSSVWLRSGSRHSHLNEEYQDKESKFKIVSTKVAKTLLALGLAGAIGFGIVGLLHGLKISSHLPLSSHAFSGLSHSLNSWQYMTACGGIVAAGVIGEAVLMYKIAHTKTPPKQIEDDDL